MSEKKIALQIENVKKRYQLGKIGGGTLRGDIKSWWAEKHHREDPNAKIGAKKTGKNDTFMALNGINLTVYQGERIGIIGHNGAGKSTLLKILSRVTGPTEGEIGINGRISSMLEVGTGFNGELSGRENIYLNGAILGMTKEEVNSKIEDIIEFSECRQFIDTPVKRYSSGMYVKLAFSVAAHLDSEIMIMDEVLAVGDMAFQKKCLDKMNEVSRQAGKTILYVSHNMSTIRQLCERCIVLSHGEVVFDGDVENAIGYYLNLAVNDEVLINYEERKDLRYQTAGHINIIETSFVGKSENLFSRTDDMLISLKWKNCIDIEDLCLRIEILRRDRSPIGTSMLYDFYSGQKDAFADGIFKLDVSQLVPGKYALTYCMFTRDRFGNNINYDNVKALNFDIASDNEEILWDAQKWGNVEFPPVVKCS